MSSTPPSRHQPRIIAPLRDFLATESSSGLLLLVAALVGLGWANSPWSTGYHDLLGTELGLRIGARGLTLDLEHWVNDGLMTLFFLVVGLEIKRELVEGELRDRRRALLPAIAAVGGMVVPALLFALVTLGDPARTGWGIPMATDIAMALGVLALVASKTHPNLKLFLLALAIVDDIGAIAVIAVFYSAGIDGTYLGIAAAVIVTLLVKRRLGFTSPVISFGLGIALWYATFRSGIHATVAGVVLAFLSPMHPQRSLDLIDAEALADLSSPAAVAETLNIARKSVSVVEWLEFRLHPWTSYLIVPLFAFANAGVQIDTGELASTLTSRVFLGVLIGLAIGKPLGITAATWLATRSGVATLPEGVTMAGVASIGALAGIGFTVSLFVANLAFSGDATLTGAAKLAILATSLVAGLTGTVALRRHAS